MGSLYRDRDAPLERQRRAPDADVQGAVIVAGAGVMVGVLVAVAVIRLFTL